MLAMKLKLIACFVAIALYPAAVHGTTFTIDNCVRLDVEGKFMVYARSLQDDQIKFSHEIDLATAPFTISGNCNEGDSARTMTVHLNQSDSGLVDWTVVVTTSAKDNMAMMDQLLRFRPSSLFDNSTLDSGLVVLDDIGQTPLSHTNASFVCKAAQDLKFNSISTNDYNFTASQALRNLQVQAFGLSNNTFSPAEECSADEQNGTTTTAPTTTPTTTPTTAPTTTPTTAPTTTAAKNTTTEPTTTQPSGNTTTPTSVPVTPPGPVEAASFAVKDDKGQACFLLEAGLQAVVEYSNTKKEMVLSKPIVLPGSATVTGTCSDGGNMTAVMTISTDDVTLRIAETASDGGEASSVVSLNVTLDPANFPDAEEVNKTLTFEAGVRAFEQKSVSTYYLCRSEQALGFNDSRTTLFANDVQLQAFNVKDGKFTGNGEECSLDPVTTAPPPSSTTTTPAPEENVYVVKNSFQNVTCIVLKGDITFTNIVYNTTSGQQATADPITIPRRNETSGNVKVSGSCDGANNTQWLTITFNGNWNLTLTFAEDSEESTFLLAAEVDDEYSLQDIRFDYVLTPEFFPNASQANTKQTAKADGMTDFMTGRAGGGSYKCNAKVTHQLDNGMEVETTNLQYKAFNADNSTSFDSGVSECPADESSSDVVPIAIGASLGGLVILLIIAYLIGRRQRQKKGYDEL